MVSHSLISVEQWGGGGGGGGGGVRGQLIGVGRGGQGGPGPPII